MCVTIAILLALGIVGIAVPWYHQRRITGRRRRRRDSLKWGFTPKHRRGPWVAHVDEPVVVEHPWDDGSSSPLKFYSDWLVIDRGYVIVSPGHVSVERAPGGQRVARYDFSRPRTYAWDGCTPKFLFYWLALVGTPDLWHTDVQYLTISTESDSIDLEPRDVTWQAALYPSLVHDALCQYRKVAPVSGRQIDLLFRDMMRQRTPSWIACLYYRMLRLRWRCCGDPNEPTTDTAECDSFEFLTSGVGSDAQSRRTRR